MAGDQDHAAQRRCGTQQAENATIAGNDALKYFCAASNSGGVGTLHWDDTALISVNLIVLWHTVAATASQGDTCGALRMPSVYSVASQDVELRFARQKV